MRLAPYLAALLCLTFLFAGATAWSADVEEEAGTKPPRGDLHIRSHRVADGPANARPIGDSPAGRYYRPIRDPPSRPFSCFFGLSSCFLRTSAASGVNDG